MAGFLHRIGPLAAFLNAIACFATLLAQVDVATRHSDSAGNPLLLTLLFVPVFTLLAYAAKLARAPRSRWWKLAGPMLLGVLAAFAVAQVGWFFCSTSLQGMSGEGFLMALGVDLAIMGVLPASALLISAFSGDAALRDVSLIGLSMFSLFAVLATFAALPAFLIATVLFAMWWVRFGFLLLAQPAAAAARQLAQE